ncbi:MAG: hypothetical protein IT580_11030, partial [Verrucomicrobiales bacterium]|nr:hypothetical protein [Verrucomicrobiales bacterium]
MAADRPVATVELDQPRVSRGLVFAESTDAAVRELARQLDAPTGPGEPTAPPTSTTPPPRSAPAAPVEESPPALESGRLISMPRLNGTELREVLDSLRLRL